MVLSINLPVAQNFIQIFSQTLRKRKETAVILLRKARCYASHDISQFTVEFHYYTNANVAILSAELPSYTISH